MPWTVTFLGDVLEPPKGWQWINPVWLASDCQRIVTWSWWQTFTRNPFANFNNFVVGVSDRPRWWISRMGFNNWPARGWGFAWLIANGCVLPRPWLCYRGSIVEIGIGWKTHGGFGINCRRANAPNAGATP